MATASPRPTPHTAAGQCVAPVLRFARTPVLLTRSTTAHSVPSSCGRRANDDEDVRFTARDMQATCTHTRTHTPARSTPRTPHTHTPARSTHAPPVPSARALHRLCGETHALDNGARYQERLHVHGPRGDHHQQPQRRQETTVKYNPSVGNVLDFVGSPTHTHRGGASYVQMGNRNRI